jgi:phenylpyruvate tautomerase PptA (4-oxalocrotonate tautomerase family)
MPIVNITVKKGCNDIAIDNCVKAVAKAIYSNLENTLPKMVRVTVEETPGIYIRDGENSPDHCAPTVTLALGPGRSEDAIAKCMADVVEAVHKELDVPKERVRFYIMFENPDNFSIGGKVKDFSKKVN